MATDRITRALALKFTGRVLMFLSALAASSRLVLREIRFDPSRVELGHDVLIEQRVAHLDDAQTEDEDERHHQRELEEGRPSRVAKPLAIGSHCHLLSFFIEESTLSVIWPLLKNGQRTGL